MRRRINIVPFVHKPAQPDLKLEEKLKDEWPGILRWMIDGCADWQANSLVRPSSVKKATGEYFADAGAYQSLADAVGRPPLRPDAS